MWNVDVKPSPIPFHNHKLILLIGGRETTCQYEQGDSMSLILEEAIGKIGVEEAPLFFGRDVK
jgi:hypothetical protein